MKNLLNFLVRYNSLIVFLILEALALYMLTAGNSYHNSRLQKGIIGLTKNLEEKIYNTRSYLSLREINERLALENSALKNSIEKLGHKENNLFLTVSDTLLGQNYQYSTAEIINNSVNKQKNFLTLNKGRRHGLDTDMAVAGTRGVAGLIVSCSENYSIAISVLNLDFKLSSRIRSNGYFGSLSWDGRNYRYAVLNEIPQHVSISVGDTVETTGYSAVFPEGMMIGTISEFEKSGSDFYMIRVELITDFKNIKYVTVIDNLKKSERIGLENQYQ